MARVIGRTDDMLIVRGVNVFPSQIEEVLLAVEGTEPHYQIVVERDGALDDIEVQVEVSERTFSDGARKMFALRERIEHRLEAVLGIGVRVQARWSPAPSSAARAKPSGSSTSARCRRSGES